CRVLFVQAGDGIRAATVTGVQTCALPILAAFAPADGGALWTQAVVEGVNLAEGPAAHVARPRLDQQRTGGSAAGADGGAVEQLELGSAAWRDGVKRGVRDALGTA